jgi:hypothetical protein
MSLRGSEPITYIKADLRDRDCIARTNRTALGSGSDWLLLAAPDQHRAQPPPLGTLGRLPAARPDVGVFYFDEAWPSASEPDELSLKPDFSPELLLSMNYIGWPILLRRDLFRRVNGFDVQFGAQAGYHLLLRLWDAGVGFARHPEVLLRHNRPRVASPQAEILACVAEFCRSHRPDYVARPGLTLSSIRLDRVFAEHPHVTLIVPTCQSGANTKQRGNPDPHIVRLLDSIATCTWPMRRLSVLVGDDSADRSIYGRREWPFRLEVVHTPRPPSQPFNYSQKMNGLWRRCETDMLVFLNDDTLPLTHDWIEALMTYSCDADVGGVGARLSFPSGRLQHAGIAGGLFGIAAHPWWGLSAEKPAYEDWPLVPRNWSMVTGAVFATRKSVLEEVNGFDERFELEFNDLDLCLKVLCQGYRIVYTPHAHLVHYERESRGPSDSPNHERHRFWRRWRGIIADDPMYHPRLNHDSFDIRPVANVSG